MSHWNPSIERALQGMTFSRIYREQNRGGERLGVGRERKVKWGEEREK